METLRHSGEHVRQPGISAEVRQQTVACPRSNEQTVEQDQPYRLPGFQRGAREPIEFGA
jgi:hypothetical protein